MAEERNSENFALGLIVAAIIYLLFRREFARLSSGGSLFGGSGGKAGAGGAGGAGAGSGGGGCGCGGAATSANYNAPPISIGGQSLSSGPPYGGSSVGPSPGASGSNSGRGSGFSGSAAGGGGATGTFG